MQPWQDPTIDQTKRTWEKFVREKLAGDFLARDRDQEFSRERWEACAQFGALGLSMPEEFGGEARPLRHTVAAYEGLGHCCGDTGFLFGLNSQIFGVQVPFLLHARPELTKKYLPGMISGKIIASLDFTEEGGGSDVFSGETTAVKTDGGFIVNGKKTFVTNAPASDCSLLFAKTAHNEDPFDFTVFLVDLSWKGASHGKTFDKATLRTVRMGEHIYDDCFVPEDHVVGRVGRGINVLQEAVGWERALLMAHVLGAMERVMDQCIERARTRNQFGKPLGNFQQVSSRIAEMVNNYRIARQLVYDIAARLDGSKTCLPLLADACGVKMFVTDAYVKQMLDATQIWGARGVLMDWSIQQDMRDSLSSTIWAGTTETLRNTIAKSVGLKPEG